MGALLNIYNKIKKKDDKKLQTQTEEQEQEYTPYNKIWLQRIATENDYKISDNEKRVDGILKALNKRDGHCPCGGMTDQFLCPCEMMREYGACKCGLYESAKDINPREAKSNAKIKE